MSCPICEKRPPKRFCPAKGEKICAVCCGREREVTIDCPSDCPHLVTAHRYEAEHREPMKAAELPYPDIRFSIDAVYERWPLVSGIGVVIAGFGAQNRSLNDRDIYSALERLAETYRTLGSGIYYERAPGIPVQQALYREVASFLQRFQREAPQQSGSASATDIDIFRLLVFLLRMNKTETSGRPRSRAFLSFLRARFPLPAAAAGAQAEQSRIIIP